METSDECIGHNQQILRQTLAARSTTPHKWNWKGMWKWESLREQWELEDMESLPGGLCACSKQPITRRFYLRNKYTNHRVTIGSVCIRQFSAKSLKCSETMSIFDVEKKLNKEMDEVKEMREGKKIRDESYDDEEFIADKPEDLVSDPENWDNHNKEKGIPALPSRKRRTSSSPSPPVTPTFKRLRKVIDLDDSDPPTVPESPDMRSPPAPTSSPMEKHVWSQIHLALTYNTKTAVQIDFQGAPRAFLIVPLYKDPKAT